MFWQGEVPMLDSDLGSIPGQQDLIEQLPEDPAIAALQILVNHHPHGAFRVAFHQALL
jgi:hypothetical protein